MPQQVVDPFQLGRPRLPSACEHKGERVLFQFGKVRVGVEGGSKSK